MCSFNLSKPLNKTHALDLTVQNRAILNVSEEVDKTAKQQPAAIKNGGYSTQWNLANQTDMLSQCICSPACFGSKPRNSITWRLQHQSSSIKTMLNAKMLSLALWTLEHHDHHHHTHEPLTPEKHTAHAATSSAGSSHCCHLGLASSLASAAASPGGGRAS